MSCLNIYLIYGDSNKHVPALAVDVWNTDISVINKENSEDKDIQLSLSTKNGLINETMTISLLLYSSNKW